jgi:hypothetical protein
LVEPIRYKDMQGKNECAVSYCSDRSGAEGLMCRRHWDMVPGAIKEQVVAGRTLALMGVHAKEMMP